MIHRDSLTWLMYGLLAFFGYLLVALGPLTALLATELGWSRTLAGSHMSFYALGTIAASLLVPALTLRLGRGPVLWFGALGMALGGILLSLARVLPMSFSAFALMGIAGASLAATIQAILADRHGPHKAIALSEANVAASISQTLSPLLAGVLVSQGLDWRWVLWLGGALALGLFVINRREVSSTGAVAPTGSGGSETLGGSLGSEKTSPGEATTVGSEQTGSEQKKLPPRFWFAWAMLVAAVCTEWAVTFWATTWLMNRVGLDAAGASLGFTAYTAAIIVGRVVGSRLARKVPTLSLLVGVLGWCLVAFPFFALATVPWASILTLSLLGFGIANLYPLGMTVTLDSAPGQTDRASALTMLAVGFGVLVSPLFLGWLGDRAPLELAFLVVPAYVSLGLLALGLRRLVTRPLSQ